MIKWAAGHRYSVALLRGPIDNTKTHLEFDEQILTDLTGIEIQAGGETLIISFAKPPQGEEDVITIGPKPKVSMEKVVKIAKRTFGKLLRAERESAGLTYKQLAAKTGLGKSTLSNYETSHSVPSEESLTYLNDALGTNWVR